MGVLKLTKSRLDLEYMRRWSVSLGVTELLDLALREVEAN
jgi:hypothetical protein